MTRLPLFLGLLLLLSVAIAGCTDSPSAQGTPRINASMNAAVNTSPVPLILTDDQWKMAGDCGWTADNISETATLFMNSCEVRKLLADNWTLEGIGYDMNIIGSRCRISTHPNAPSDCDWCLDAGPVLVLKYKGGMETEYLANLKEKTVRGYSLTLPGDAWSDSGTSAERVIFHNGTVFYTFPTC